MKANAFKGKHKIIFFVIAPIVLCVVIACVFIVSVNNRNAEAENTNESGKVAYSVYPDLMSAEGRKEAIMEKVYVRRYWQNAPDKTTPLNAENLDNIEAGIDALDDRVVALNGTLGNFFVDITSQIQKVADNKYCNKNGKITNETGYRVFGFVPKKGYIYRVVNSNGNRTGISFYYKGIYEPHSTDTNEYPCDVFVLGDGVSTLYINQLYDTEWAVYEDYYASNETNISSRVEKVGDDIYFNASSKQIIQMADYHLYSFVPENGHIYRIVNSNGNRTAKSFYYGGNYEPHSTDTNEYPCDVFVVGNGKNTLYINQLYDTEWAVYDISITLYESDSASEYSGMSGVAFGTSLTYRSQTVGGYLSYLEDLSGITFENKGEGSSCIYGGEENGILTKIQNYTDFANKDIVIIEGFVNDWYGSKPLGTYTDTTRESVCGCLYQAINHIYEQNANITLFVILDHYGRSYNSADESSTAIVNNYTQYQYYEECAKVCESLGIKVIKEYALSGISQLTPQYLVDDIHCTALGAEQSANTIWAEMKKYVPNVIN
jgi:hypothetical protein